MFMHALALLGFFLIFLVAAFAAVYVCKSLGLYRLAQKRNLENPWVAWVPFLRNYIIGELTGNKMWGVEGSKWVLALVPFGLFLMNFIPYAFPLEIVIGLAFTVYYYMALFELFKEYKPESADLYIITSILFNFLGPIYILVISHLSKRQQMPTEQTNVSEQLYENMYEEANETESLPEEVNYFEQSFYGDVREKLAQANEEVIIESLNDQEAKEMELELGQITKDLENYIDLGNDFSTEEGSHEIVLELPKKVEVEEDNEF